MQEKQRPSILLGLRSAWSLRRLVIIVWLVGFVLFVPASLIVNDAAGSALSRLPDNWIAPSGEETLLLIEAFEPMLQPFGIVVGSTMVLVWFFSIWWHAGVARFEVWGKGPPTVSEILGLGLGAWWRYFRLSVTAVVVLFVLMMAIWAVILASVTSAFESMAEERMVFLLAIGIVVGAVVKIVIWAATLRGAWELAAPSSRSALGAWVRGLAGTFRNPLTTLGALMVLGSAMVVCAVLPLVVSWLFPVLRSASLSTAVGAAAGLGAAFFSVALFSAFAPVSGFCSPMLRGERVTRDP